MFHVAAHSQNNSIEWHERPLLPVEMLVQGKLRSPPAALRQRSEEACYADGVVFLSSSAWEADPLMQAVRLSLMGSERVKSSNIHS